jgi:uncharacterized membrane protein YoaK (UPF0700 family)
LIGLYPGVFFARLSEYYRARQLFFRENNGFIIGLASGTLLFLVLGRAALWGMPVLAAGVVMLCTTLVFRNNSHSNALNNELAHPTEEMA